MRVHVYRSEVGAGTRLGTSQIIEFHICKALQRDRQVETRICMALQETDR